MSYTTPLIEYMHTLSSQSNTKESCAVLPLHDRDFLQPLHTSNFPPSLCGLIICKRGELQISDGKSDKTLFAMSVLPLTPWQSITLHQPSDFSADIVLFGSHSINNGLIQTDYACDLLLHFLLHTIIPIADEEYSSLKNILKVVERLNNMHSESKSFVFASQHAVATILYIMHDAVAKYERGKKARFQNRQSELFTEFFRLLTNNYKQQRSVMYYAEQMCLTPRYLSRVVKEFSGRSAAEWINIFVVAEIQYQMRYTMRSVQQIAYDMNFPNQSFFGKYFKAHVGCSPKVYRLR